VSIKLIKKYFIHHEDTKNTKFYFFVSSW